LSCLAAKLVPSLHHTQHLPVTFRVVGNLLGADLDRRSLAAVVPGTCALAAAVPAGKP
jgi:hypothetical protein